MALTQVNQGLLGEYAQYTGFKNRIINGAMMIDQRNAGASVTFNTAGTYLVDRWTQNNGGGATITGQQSSTAPSGFKNSLLVTTTSGGSPSTGYLRIFSQYVEGYNVADLGWGTASAQPVTASFWVRSSVTGTFSAYVSNSAFNRSQVQTYTINAANTWEYKSVTFSGDTAGTWLTDNGIGIGLGFDVGSGTNFNATAGVWTGGFYTRTSGSTTISATTGATFYITGVQLEKGSTATSFDYRPYGTELALCQRYCQAWGGATAYEVISVGMCQSSTTAGMLVNLETKMRTSPSLSYSALSDWGLGSSNGATIYTVTAMSIDQAGTQTVNLSVTASGGLLSAGNATRFFTNGTTNGRLFLTAEL